MEEIERQFNEMKKMWEDGCTSREIATAFNTHISNVFNTFSLMGYSTKKKEDLKPLVYADNRVILEKIVINGKRYVDITPLFAPR